MRAHSQDEAEGDPVGARAAGAPSSETHLQSYETLFHPSARRRTKGVIGIDSGVVDRIARGDDVAKLGRLEVKRRGLSKQINPTRDHTSKCSYRSTAL